MSRDMQIGMLLAVGFLALVGGVLYYRIEHPDELEQYLNGEQQAQLTSPAGDIKTQADASTANSGNKPLPPAPSTASTAPSLSMDAGSTTATNVPGANSSPNLMLTGANGTPPTGVSPSPVNTAPAMPTLDFAALDKKPTDNKPPTPPVDNKPPETAGATASRSSLPVDTPGSKLPAAAALAAAPVIALDLANKNDKPPAPAAGKPPEVKVDEKKPVDLTVKSDAPAPAASSAPDLKLPPAPTGAPSLVMSDTAKPKESELSKSQELPKPPEVPALGASTAANAPDTRSGAVPSLTLNVPSPAPSSVPATPLANKDIPETVIKPAATPENDALRGQAPRATLGKPMTESEASLKEKRWADSAGAPAPIIPLSADGRGNTVTAPASTLGERRVVRDTYIPTERALKGETFSSLSQRLYGDTNYAVALAAYNKEEGFVKMDQPEPNEWVAKPNREILDQRYPQLIRRLTPSTFNQRNAATMAQAQPAEKTAKDVNLPTYRVGKGEQLFEVAKKTLGDGYRWSEIYSLNKDQFRESTELRPDMILKLPADAKK